MADWIDFLCGELIRVEKQAKGIPQLVEYGMASRLLCLIFGYEWYEQRIKFRSEDPDEWMLNGADAWLAAHPVENDVRRIVHTHRVIRLAIALFTVAGVEGFDALRDRFLHRATKPCFIEAEIASTSSATVFRLKS